MKQKYTITVSDMEMNIISDASPDEVENIVGILDRRMRDINLKSPRCTKNEAAILCALSYCSERIAMQEAFKKVEKDAFRFAGENEKLKKTIENMQEEMDSLRKDASVMRSILDRAAISATAPQATTDKPKYIPKPFKKAEEKKEPEPVTIPESVPADTVPTAPVPSANTADASEPKAVPAVAVADPSANSNKSQKPANKSRVGSMFDLLTFSDI